MNIPTIPKVKKPRAKNPSASYPSSDRVYLAGNAMEGLLACPTTKGPVDQFGKDAVRYADAIIAALGGGK